MAKKDATQVKKKSDQKLKKKNQVKKTSKKIQKGKKEKIKEKAKPQGEMKFYYFDCYAVGEPIRMALHKAGVQY